MKRMLFYARILLALLCFSFFKTGFATVTCTNDPYTSPTDHFAMLRGTMNGTENCTLGLNSSETPTIRITGYVKAAYGGVSIYSNAYLPGNITENLSNYTINDVAVENSASFQPAALGSSYNVQGDYTYNGYKYTVVATLTFNGVAPNGTVVFSNTSITVENLNPTVTSVSPNVGPTTGGTSITITGTKFTNTTGVTIGGTAATSVTVVNDTTITATTPVGTAGAQDIVVTTNVGSGTGSSLFTYGTLPSISAVTPASGATAGGTAVTITGANLTNTSAVTIGGMSATDVTVVDSTTVTLTTPAGTAGAKDVVLTTNIGSATSVGAYTYSDAREDPATNAIVRGEVISDVVAAQKFTSVQINNVSGHLQELHHRFDVHQGQFNLQFNLPDTPKMNVVMRILNAFVTLKQNFLSKKQTETTRHNDSLASNPLFNLVQAIANGNPALLNSFLRNQAATAGHNMNNKIFGDKPFGIWASGKFGAGSMYVDRAKVAHFLASGVTLGLDRQFRPDLIMGLAIGLGTDVTTLDHFGSKSKSVLKSDTFYLTYQYNQHWFFDALFGYGNLRYNNKRWHETGSAMLEGNRNGHIWFGSLAVTSEIDFKQFSLAPYLREEIASTTLDSYNESGDADYALTYKDTRIMSYATAAGVSGHYDRSLTSGKLRSTVKLQYKHIFKGDINQHMYYSDQGESGGDFLFTSGAVPQNTTSLGFTISELRFDGFIPKLSYTGTLGSKSYRAYTIKAELRKDF